MHDPITVFPEPRRRLYGDGPGVRQHPRKRIHAEKRPPARSMPA